VELLLRYQVDVVTPNPPASSTDNAAILLMNECAIVQLRVVGSSVRPLDIEITESLGVCV
jgi:hypothetical protein